MTDGSKKKKKKLQGKLAKWKVKIEEKDSHRC